MEESRRSPPTDERQDTAERYRNATEGNAPPCPIFKAHVLHPQQEESEYPEKSDVGKKMSRTVRDVLFCFCKGFFLVAE